MPHDQHANPAGEPSPRSSPGPSKDQVAEGTTFLPGLPRDPSSRIRIQTRVTRIGRRPYNDIVISDLSVSERHAELRRTRAGQYSITDLDSHSGTYVNGDRVSQQELQEGDIIVIGRVTLRLVSGQLVERIDDGRSPS